MDKNVSESVQEREPKEGFQMSRDDYRDRKAKAKALRLRRAEGKRAKSAQRSMAGGPGCY